MYKYKCILCPFVYCCRTCYSVFGEPFRRETMTEKRNVAFDNGQTTRKKMYDMKHLLVIFPIPFSPPLFLANISHVSMSSQLLFVCHFLQPSDILDMISSRCGQRANSMVCHTSLARFGCNEISWLTFECERCVFHSPFEGIYNRFDCLQAELFYVRSVSFNIYFH